MSNKVWSIGRKNQNQCDILVEGDTISAIHASLNYIDGKFYVIDNSSRNGSYLVRGDDSILLTNHTEILPNDIIIFGDIEFTFNRLIALSSKYSGTTVKKLTVKKLTAEKVTVEKVIKKQIPESDPINTIDRKKIRCSECAKVILSNDICPSCYSNKHLK